MATAQQPLDLEVAFLLDLGLPFAGLGQEFGGVVAKGLGLGAFCGPAGFDGLAGRFNPFFWGAVLRGGLATFFAELSKVFANFSLGCHQKDINTFAAGAQELS
jgi:hypothetical protein